MTSMDAPFETMRKLFQDAADQLAVNLSDQRENYPMAGDVLALIDAVAERMGTGPWTVWQSWVLRHWIPVEETLDQPVLTQKEYAALEKRLRDMLGYCVLGLALCARNKHD